MIDELDSTLELTKRTVFCHPLDEVWIKNNILAEDISIITSSYFQRNSYIATKDIIVDVKFQLGITFEDFRNNEYSIITYHTFS
jgi:hypothetical protein